MTAVGGTQKSCAPIGFGGGGGAPLCEGPGAGSAPSAPLDPLPPSPSGPSSLGLPLLPRLLRLPELPLLLILLVLFGFRGGCAKDRFIGERGLVLGAGVAAVGQSSFVFFLVTREEGSSLSASVLPEGRRFDDGKLVYDDGLRSRSESPERSR